VYTDFRPVPLQHYIFPSGGDGLFLVVDEKGTFREENFQKALSILTPDTDKKKRHSKGGNTDPYKIVKMIMERNYEPVIVFSFSKRSCENLALQMAKLDFNNDDEKKLVSIVYQNALDTLNDDDRKLPQVEQILPLLKRGIGIHHSGLLPLLKEVIELLFQEGLIKCLFATETFSIGLNMPAKTVVFTSVRKFDGSDFRWVSGGEYIQMSGRAGRRGKDDRGIVIMMVDEKMEPTVAQGMVKGHADTLNSSFHIGYNMLLNLLRTDFFTPEAMLKQSFHQFQNDGAIPTLARKVKELEGTRDLLVIEDEDTVAEYYALRLQIEKMGVMIRQMIQQPAAILPFLSAGRLIRVRDFDNEQDWGWGVVVNFHQRTVPAAQSANSNDKKALPAPAQVKYIVDVLLACAPNEPKHLPPKPCPTGTEPDMQVVPITLAMIENVSSIKLHLPKDLRPMDARKSVLKSLKETKKYVYINTKNETNSPIRRMPGDIPVLDPVETMGIKDPNFKKIVRVSTSEVLEPTTANFVSLEIGNFGR
jgi:ATP-dependent RNA helicase DOB1